MAKEITRKQQVFIAEYLTDLNATRAAIAAGYSEKGATVTGSKLLANPKVSEVIAKKTEKRLGKLEVTAEYVLRNIIDVGERCMQKRMPVMVGQGKDRVQAKEFVVNEETGEEVLANVWQFDTQGALKAQELLGKHLKLFTEKTEITGENGGPVVFTLAKIGEKK